MQNQQVNEKPRRGWPPQRRAQQAARLRARRIWLQSTGPRTATGKAKSRHNAVKSGHYCETPERRVGRALRAQERFLKLVRLWLRATDPRNRHADPALPVLMALGAQVLFQLEAELSILHPPS